MLVLAAELPDLADGEFHLLDLVGLEARFEANGKPIGTVSNLISGYGGHHLEACEQQLGQHHADRQARVVSGR